MSDVRRAFDAMRRVLEKFTRKVESGRAKSVLTYQEAKEALRLAEEATTKSGESDWNVVI